MCLPYCIYSLMNGDAFRCEDNRSPPLLRLFSCGPVACCLPPGHVKGNRILPLRGGWLNDWKSELLYTTADCNGSQNSAVSLVTRLEAAWPSNRGSVLGRIERFLSFQSVYTGSGAHPASCSMRTRSFFPWGNAAWAWSWLLIPI